MSNETIIDRIKKLLRLASDKRGNAHEAERAMQLAFELAEKHRIELEALNLDEESEKLVREYINIGQRFDRMRRGVFSILQSFFHVSLLHDSDRMMIVGKPSDVAIAHYVHDFLLRTGRNCLSAYCADEKLARRRMTQNKRASFTAGFFYGIGQNLKAAKERLASSDHTAIVVVEEANRQKYIEDHVKSVGGKIEALARLADRKGHQNALMTGVAHGRATQINQPLNATPGQRETLSLQ